MTRYRLTSCDCGRTHLRLMPRHWWMRLLPGRRYYRCRECNAAMLLRTEGSHRGMGGGSLVLLVLALLLVAWVSFYAVGYLDERSYASGKSRAENQ